MVYMFAILMLIVYQYVYACATQERDSLVGVRRTSPAISRARTSIYFCGPLCTLHPAVAKQDEAHPSLKATVVDLTELYLSE